MTIADLTRFARYLSFVNIRLRRSHSFVNDSLVDDRFYALVLAWYSVEISFDGDRHGYGNAGAVPYLLAFDRR